MLPCPVAGTEAADAREREGGRPLARTMTLEPGGQRALSRRAMIGTIAVPALVAACGGPDQAAAPPPAGQSASLIMHTDWLTGPRGDITTQSLAEYAKR